MVEITRPVRMGGNAVADRLRELAAARAVTAGAEAVEIDVARDIRAATVEGQRTFVEALLTATAAGRPRVAA